MLDVFLIVAKFSLHLPESGVDNCLVLFNSGDHFSDGAFTQKVRVGQKFLVFPSVGLHRVVLRLSKVVVFGGVLLPS